MPSYSGKFQYVGEGGQLLSDGACKISFDKERFTLTPASGAAVAFDLADVDRIYPAEWELGLELYTGKRLALRQFGAAFAGLVVEFEKAWRNRTIAALLLEDMAEVARFEGAYSLNGDATRSAEIRIFESNIAVLPRTGSAFQWRLAEVDSWEFDQGTYTFVLLSEHRKLVLSKFAKKTEEFASKLREVFEALRQHAAETLLDQFPFLDPDQLWELAGFLREGRSVSVPKLRELDSRLPELITKRFVSASLRPYFDWLRSRAGQENLMTGFKFLRPEDGDPEVEADALPVREVQLDTDGHPFGQAEQKGQEQPPIFFWFFFPIRDANMVAWESTSGSGRATYFFRVPPGVDVEEHVQRLTGALALINFRREPIYLPNDSLMEQPRFHRYAIAARKIPDLRTLRESFAGRAIHLSPEAWESQAKVVLASRS